MCVIFACGYLKVQSQMSKAQSEKDRSDKVRLKKEKNDRETAAVMKTLISEVRYLDSLISFLFNAYHVPSFFLRTSSARSREKK